MRAQTPGGSNFCSTASTASTSACDAPSRSAACAQIRRQITGLVDQIDQILPDHALRRIGEGHRQLFGEMAAERHLGGDEGFEIVAVVVGGAAAPFGIGGRRRILRGARGGLGRLLGKDVVEAGYRGSARSRCGCRGRGSSSLPGGGSKPSPADRRPFRNARRRRRRHRRRPAPHGRNIRPARRRVRRRPAARCRRWRAPAADCAPVPPRRRPKGRDWTAAAA